MSDQQTPEPENLQTVYREICQTHRAISEFRAKLLTLLPLASGTGIFLLVTRQGQPLDPTHLVAVGVFGSVVTLGLFFHELRGIWHCRDLIKLGKSLEEQLELRDGQFTRDYAYYLGKFRLIGPDGAAWVIYPALLLAWAYLAVSRLLLSAEAIHAVPCG